MPTAQSAFARAALHGAGFTFRPATLADVRWTAELQTAREPDEPANEEQLRHWWQFHDREHIEITTIDVVADPEKWRKLHAMCEASVQDIPTTVPHAPESFESFMQWMSSPGMHADRLWVAREGTAIVGMSVLGYPPGVGNVWTDYTGTSRAVRGRRGGGPLDDADARQRDAERAREPAAERRRRAGDAEHGAPDPAVPDERARDAARGGRGDREADALGIRDDRGIHADDPRVGVD